MRVLGLDPGSRSTGFGVIERTGNQYHCVLAGAATATARLGLPQRLLLIIQRVGEIMDQSAPDCVAIEEAFYHQSVRSTLVLGHVRGALLVAALQRGLAIAEYSPREVKMSVTGNGGAAKEQVAFMVQRVLATRGTLTTDASDALAVALCHHHRAHRAAPERSAMSAAAQKLEALLARRVAR